MSAAPSSKLRAYLELARISNLPTCLSNVLVGVAIASAAGAAVEWGTWALVSVAVGLLYVSGMAINDAVDQIFDAQERPGRPIPSGRVSCLGAWTFAGVTMGLGLAMVVVFRPFALVWAGALAATIVAYDLVHKRFAPSIVLMGACRGLVYVVAAAAVGGAWDVTQVAVFATAMTAYVVVLTAVARREHRPERPPIVGVLGLFAIVLAPIAFVRPAEGWTYAAAAALLVVAWLAGAAAHVRARPPRVKHAVMAWLAGICLADAYFLTLIDRPGAAAVAIGCFVVTAVGHRFVLGT